MRKKQQSTNTHLHSMRHHYLGSGSLHQQTWSCVCPTSGDNVGHGGHHTTHLRQYQCTQCKPVWIEIYKCHLSNLPNVLLKLVLHPSGYRGQKHSRTCVLSLWMVLYSVQFLTISFFYKSHKFLFHHIL